MCSSPTISGYAAILIAHVARDNYYLTDLFLSQNPSLLSNPVSCQEISNLVQTGHVRYHLSLDYSHHFSILEIRNCGVDDDTAKILSQVHYLLFDISDLP